MINKIKIFIQHALPKHLVTKLVGKLAKRELGGFTQFMITWFVQTYNINLHAAQLEKVSDYKTFNEFFTRKLKPELRPIIETKESLCFPADAEMSQFGAIFDNQLIQAKGHKFSLLDLLAGDQEMADKFVDGSFATLYLSPKDYHRVHMPCSGTLRKMIYVPGELFSVNILTSQHVPNLFSRNERVVCLFDTKYGPMVQILVGATIVGSIDTVWHGCVNNEHAKEIKEWSYPQAGSPAALSLEKGAEMGLFKLGSTVINLFPANTVEFDKHVQIGRSTKVGAQYAQFVQDSPIQAEK